MRFKRRFIFVLLAGTLLLSACNLAVVTPTPMTTPTATASQTPVPTSTVTPLPFGQMPTPTLYLIIPPTPTLTLFYNPTATTTPSWSDCPLIVTRNETNKGVMLHVRRCEDNLEYDLGPLAKGVYAVGPNGKFIIYVTHSGMLYATNIGNTRLSLLVNLRRAGSFVAFNKNVQPVFVISFYGEAPRYRLILTEKKYNQRRAFYIPPRIME